LFLGQWGCGRSPPRTSAPHPSPSKHASERPSDLIAITLLGFRIDLEGFAALVRQYAFTEKKMDVSVNLISSSYKYIVYGSNLTNYMYSSSYYKIFLAYIVTAIVWYM